MLRKRLTEGELILLSTYGETQPLNQVTSTVLVNSANVVYADKEEEITYLLYNFIVAYNITFTKYIFCL